MSTQEYIDILKVHAPESDLQIYIDTFLNKELTPLRIPLFKRVNCPSGFLCCTGRCLNECGDISIPLNKPIQITNVSYSTTSGGYIFELLQESGEKFRLDQRGLMRRLEYGHATLSE